MVTVFLTIVTKSHDPLSSTPTRLKVTYSTTRHCFLMQQCPRQRSECKAKAGLLHQLTVWHAAVATHAHLAPSQYTSIDKNGSKRARKGLDLLHILQSITHSTTVATAGGSPQVTTGPFTVMAAKALNEAWICCKFANSWLILHSTTIPP